MSAELERKKQEQAEEEPSDLFEIFMKPVGDLTTEEIQDTLTKLRSLRTVRINTKKGKSVLDQILEQLSPENAQKVLQQMEKNKSKEQQQ